MNLKNEKLTEKYEEIHSEFNQLKEKQNGTLNEFSKTKMALTTEKKSNQS